MSKIDSELWVMSNLEASLKFFFLQVFIFAKNIKTLFDKELWQKNWRMFRK